MIMYLKHFGLREKPFSLTPDTQLFFNRNSHKNALDTLLLALHEGEGFLKVVGEVGTGKTLLCRTLLGRLNRNQYATAFIPNPWLTPEELKLFLASEVGADTRPSMHSHELTSAIYRRLVQLARQKRKVVLLIDEAQAMPVRTIESLRLLTNLESEKRKLLQVVIFGQPELDVLLARRDLRQLQQRIVFSEKLTPLDSAAVSDYVRFRIRACGGDTKLFNSPAIRFLASASGGIPRLINILAHKALLCAYGKGDRRISAWHVARAVADTRESTTKGKWISYFWKWYPHHLLYKVSSKQNRAIRLHHEPY